VGRNRKEDESESGSENMAYKEPEVKETGSLQAEAKLKEAEAKLHESEAKLKECELHLKGKKTEEK